MKHNFYMPVRIISGRGCIRANTMYFPRGKRCLIVTGKRSAKSSGALVDVTAALDNIGVDYAIFDRIIENPPVSVCYEGGEVCRTFGADFVIGIGGGSPIDGAKAIAAYAANPDIMPSELFNAGLLASLPIVAVPTTAGTGSEANHFSVLTIDETNIKQTFVSAHSYPCVAFLDAAYTESLGETGTLSTALDAFCHCFESFMSPRSTDITKTLAKEGTKILWRVLLAGKSADLPEAIRNELLYASCLGGMVIGMTGTGFPHPLGYPLTLEKGVSHGRACAAFCTEYIEYNQRIPDGKAAIDSFCSVLGASPVEVGALITKLSGHNIKLNESEVVAFAQSIKNAKNYTNSPYAINFGDIKDIYRKLFV